MHFFIKKNQKKLMAIFGAALMVAFLVPYGMNQTRDTDPVRGSINGQAIHASELANARNDWERLLRIREFNYYQYNFVPIVFRLGENAVQNISAHPDLFCVLQREAIDMGVTVTHDQIETMRQSEQIQFPTTKDIVEHDNYINALRNLLLVEKAFQRVASNIKISAPMSRRLLAQYGQEIKVSIVEFPSDAYKSDVKVATTQQVSDQFTKWSQTEPDRISRENPFGFGYRYPNRVKLQYIAIPNDQVKKAVQASKPEQDWAVAARRYYRAHMSEFQTAQTTTAPTTTQPAGPTTRPFDEVKDQVMEQVLAPLVERQRNEIINRIVGQLNSDWVAASRALEAKPPTTAPATSLGVPYTSFDYLQKLAQDIQKQFGVLPTVVNVDQYSSRKDLVSMPGIGRATVEGRPFADQAVTLAAPFFTEEQRNRMPVTNLWQPSAILTDTDQNAYLFRLTDTRAAETPKDVSEVASIVEADLLKESTLRVARTTATSFLDQSRKTSFADAATAAGKTIITTEHFDSRQSVVPGYALDQTSTQQFIAECFRLLNQPSKDGARVMGTIELPQAGKVVVVQIEDVRPVWTEENMAAIQAQVNSQAWASAAQMLQAEWFDYESAKSRTNYQPAR